MKLHILVFVTSLVLQVQASFIDDFRHAVRHVEHGFEKMLSDVVSDMEDTIHCTVAAMEHILIINGILDKLSDYKKKCPDEYSEAKAREAQHETSSDLGARDANNKYITSQELHSSIYNVNRTLNNILLKQSEEDTVKGSLSDQLRNESNRLSEVSAMLRSELEKIFSNVRGELDKIDFEQKSPEAVVRDEIRLLQEAEKDGNTSELDEIRHVVDDAINVLKSDTTTNSERKTNSEIDKIVKELENTENGSFQQYKAGKDRESAKLKKEHKSSDENVFTVAGKKDIIKHNKNQESEPSNYVSSLFSSFGKSNEKETINEVMDLVKESQVVNMLFKDDQPGTDLFESTFF